MFFPKRTLSISTLLCCFVTVFAEAEQIEVQPPIKTSTDQPAPLPQIESSPAPRVSEGNSPKTVVNSEPVPSVAKRSRIALSFDLAGGVLWNYGLQQNTAVADDGSTYQTYAQIRASQPHLMANVGLSIYVLDACQLSKETVSSSCVDLLTNLRLGVGNQFTRNMRAIQAMIGVEGDFYFGHQRRVAFTTKLDIGYAYIFAPDLGEQANLSSEYRLQPGSTHALLVAASPGILVNLGSVVPAARAALYADVQAAFYGGQFSLLVPVGIRIRF